MLRRLRGGVQYLSARRTGWREGRRGASLKSREVLPKLLVLVLLTAFFSSLLLVAGERDVTSATAAAIGDAYVDSSTPTSNLGARERVRMDASPELRGYLRFDVAGLSGVPTRAVLRLHSLTNSSLGYEIRTVAGAWEEATITWNNAPPLGAVVASSGATTNGTWEEIDVTSAVTQNGLVDFGIATASSTVMAVASKEYSNQALAPQLSVEAAPEPSPTPSDTPTPTPSPSPSPTPTLPSGPVDRAIEARIYDGRPIKSAGSYPYDYNNDGLQDVLINTHNDDPSVRLYRNDGGGQFTHVYAGMFISRSPSGTIRKDRHGCAWADVNQDGLPDFYCSMGANKGTLTDKANELWIQQPGGGFANQSAAYGVTDPLGPGRDVTFVDVNHDAFPDLYVTNNNRPDGRPSLNRLFINQGGTSFRDAPEYGINEQLGGVPGNQSCAQAVDYNKDGWEDIFVCGKSGLWLYRNDAGVRFTNVTTSIGIASGTWRHARMADLNGDEWLDIVGITVTQFRVQIYSGAAFGPLAATRTLVEGRQVAAGDVNHDARPDVYVVQGSSQPDVMLINDGAGTSFTQTIVPQASSGSGQSVTAFDHDQNGTADMIVMNGYESTRGPIQLISFPGT